MKKLLPLLFLFACNKKPLGSFPRVVKSLCGTYAVQTLSWNHGFQKNNGDMEYKWDTAYLGVNENPTSMYSVVGPNGGSQTYTISGSGWFSVMTSSDSTSVEYLRTKHHAMVWASFGDTVYDAFLPHEIAFKTEAEAIRAMNSYWNKKMQDSLFEDSIMRCHKYLN